MVKAFSYKRVIAYIIDIIIISIIASLITVFFPGGENLTKLNEEYTSITESYLNGDIDSNEYINRSGLITYDIDMASVPLYLVQTALIVAYFVVFQFYNCGQTIGKKIMKIKVVSVNDNKLGLNDYLYRSIILNSVLSNILLVAFVLFISKKYYFYVSLTLQFIQIVLILITIFMVLFKRDGRGLHDFVAHSKVIEVE